MMLWGKIISTGPLALNKGVCELLSGVSAAPFTGLPQGTIPYRILVCRAFRLRVLSRIRRGTGRELLKWEWFLERGEAELSVPAPPARWATGRRLGQARPGAVEVGSLPNVSLRSSETSQNPGFQNSGRQVCSVCTRGLCFWIRN